MTTNKILKIVLIVIIVFGFFSCETSEEDAKDFAKSVVKDLTQQDSISLYNKLMDGEVSGRYGLFTNLKHEDNPKSPAEFIKLSKENYDNAKSSELSRLSRITSRFKNSYDSKIKSIETDSIYVIEESEIQDLSSTFFKRKKIRTYRVIMKIETESGETSYFRPGFIISLNGKFYYDTSDFMWLKDKSN